VIVVEVVLLDSFRPAGLAGVSSILDAWDRRVAP